MKTLDQMQEMAAAIDVPSALAEARKSVEAGIVEHADAARAISPGHARVVEAHGRRLLAEAVGLERCPPREAVRMMHGRWTLVSAEDKRGGWRMEAVDRRAAMGVACALAAGVAALACLGHPIWWALLSVVPAIGLYAGALVTLGTTYLVGPIDALGTPAPKGVLLRMAELRRAGIFQQFVVVASAADFKQSWVQRLNDPVVLGCVSDPRDVGVLDASDDDFYFVAKW